MACGDMKSQPTDLGPRQAPIVDLNRYQIYSEDPEGRYLQSEFVRYYANLNGDCTYDRAEPVTPLWVTFQWSVSSPLSTTYASEATPTSPSRRYVPATADTREIPVGDHKTLSWIQKNFAYGVERIEIIDPYHFRFNFKQETDRWIEVHTEDCHPIPRGRHEGVETTIDKMIAATPPSEDGVWWMDILHITPDCLGEHTGIRDSPRRCDPVEETIYHSKERKHSYTR